MKYRETIQKALDSVESNLFEGVSVSEIAGDTRYSKFHFHRLFVAVVGMPVGEYIRRRRLTEAAISILESEKPLIEIAFDAGYESQESFTRAFKTWFSVTPLRYRKSGIPSFSSYQMKITLTEGDQRDMNLELVTKELEAFEVVGLAKNYKLRKPNDIPELWQEFNKRFHEISNAKSNSIFYGVCTTEGCAEDEFQYVACVEVQKNGNTPKGMTRLSLNKNKYAVFSVTGVQNLPDAYEEIYGKLIPESQLELTNEPDFEFYDHRFNPSDPLNSEIDIYVPVK